LVGSARRLRRGWPKAEESHMCVASCFRYFEVGSGRFFSMPETIP
jgi:hypothetical protein